MNLFTNFKIERLIGEGLNAYVYKVTIKDRSIGFNKVMALKVLKRKEDLGHFKKELTNLMQASGKRLVKFYGWRKYRGRPGILIEFVDGVSLFELINTSYLSLDEKNLVLNEVFKGLGELKGSGLFHGDLSPKNIMVDVAGKIKLIDFGLTNWRTKLIEATPRFVSSNILDGKTPSYSTDIDSLKALREYLDSEECFKTLKLKNLTKHEVRASLGKKVERVKEVSIKNTEQFFASNEVNYEKQSSSLFVLGLKKSSLFSFAVCLAFLSPVKLGFSQKNIGFLIRGKDWLAVKAVESKSWCYAPCRLTYLSGGIKKIIFKSAEKSGVKRLNLNKNEYKHVDQSEFY